MDINGQILWCDRQAIISSLQKSHLTQKGVSIIAEPSSGVTKDFDQLINRHVRSGLHYGSSCCVYEGDPLLHHSKFCVFETSQLSTTFLAYANRAAATVGKEAVVKMSIDGNPKWIKIIRVDAPMIDVDLDKSKEVCSENENIKE